MAAVTSFNVIDQCMKRWAKNPKLSMVELHREMVQRGYTESYQTLARKLREVRPQGLTTRSCWQN